MIGLQHNGRKVSKELQLYALNDICTVKHAFVCIKNFLIEDCIVGKVFFLQQKDQGKSEEMMLLTAP